MPDDTLRRALAGVMRGGQEGRLPLFACTLGLPQNELLRMVAQCFPELPPQEPMTVSQYALVQESVPAHFHDLVGLLLAHSTHKTVAPQARWLAHAVAAGCFGAQHLWADLELDGRESVSELLREHFVLLHSANTGNLRWKRFLFTKLGHALGLQDMRPPKCHQCDHFAQCYPTTNTSSI